MSLAGKALKGSVLITGSEAASQVCSLLRNIILARVLAKDDFGIAAMLGMSVSIFEIGGRLSIEFCIVQSKNGDQPHFMAVAHFVQSMLGLLSGFLIFITAHPMARFFDVPDAVWALQVMALFPVLRSLSHLDVYRMQREFNFGPSVLIDLIPQLVITLAVWPLTLQWKTYAVLVYLLLGKQLVSTVASHCVARRPYRWAYDPPTSRTILAFGWPMLINGFLIFAIMQGDRFAVGIKYSVAELGVYSIAGSLALVPAATLLRLSGSLLLPLLSSARADSALFLRRMTTSSEIMALFSAVYAAVMIVAGSALVTLIFGAKYSEAGILTGWLGTAQALRLMRCLPTNGAMSKGDTKNTMYSNVFRLSGLALAFPLAMAGASLAVIAACAAIGEAVALMSSFWLFSRLHRVTAASYLPAFSLASGFIVLCAALAWLGLPRLQPWIPLGTASLLILGFVAVHFALFHESRRMLLAKLLPLLPFLSRYAS